MEEDKDTNYKESSEKKLVDGKGLKEDDKGVSIASDNNGFKEPSDDTFKMPDSSSFQVLSDGNFKVPSDIGFKRPMFNKAPKRVVKSDPVVMTAEQQEEQNNSEESQETSKLFVKSPAQQIVEKLIPLPYKEPTWSGLPENEFSFEVLKNGVIVEAIPLDKPFKVIGRLAQCDIVLEHPSLSRFHCVIQYRAKASDEMKQGFYVYDLGSTHGSFQNKHRLKPHVYYRLHVGHVLKFGGSSRMLILQGPEEDEEPESELSLSELKAEAAKRAEKLRRLETGEIEEEDKDKQNHEDSSEEGEKDANAGIDWGMGEDAEEEEEGGENPFASLNEELYLNDPKKTLRGWFEREGYDLPEYIAEDVNPGVYKCKVELPIPGPGGGPLVAIVEHKGRKKAAVIQCALEACRLLDKRGVLRQAKHESHEKKRKDWAKNDYYDSDEDDFLDRTGDVQRKRLRRMKSASGKDAVAESYSTLMRKYEEVIDELSSLEKKLADAEKFKQTAETSRDEDDLDSYMRKLKSQVPDKHKRVNWKLRTIELRKDEMRLRRLANVAKPFDKPELQPYHSVYDTKQKLATKTPFQRGTVSPKKLEQPKESGIRVHKAFLEEEPERKLKLRRLDDDDDPPVTCMVARPKPIALKKEEPLPRAIKNEEPIPRALKKEEPSRQKLPMDPIRDFKKEKFMTKQREDSHSFENESHEASITKVNTPSRLSSVPVDSDVNLDSSKSEDVTELEDRVKGNDIVQAENTTVGEREVSLEKKPRLMGPTLPSSLEYLKAGQQQEPSKAKKKSSKKAVVYEDVAKYDTWIPPSNQTGDGRTSLNDKYGY